MPFTVQVYMCFSSHKIVNNFTSEIGLPLQIIFFHKVCLALSSIQYNMEYDVIVSVDRSAMLEYWGGVSHDYKFPSNLQFQYKTDTDLYEFAKVRLFVS